MITVKHYCENCEGLVIPDSEETKKSIYNLICPDCNKILEKNINIRRN